MSLLPPQITNLTVQRFVALVLGALALGLTGCATPMPPGDAPRMPGSLPAEALVTHRTVLTVRGRQFALNGYLALSKTGARRLLITEMFGHVLADVLVKRDGSAQVKRSSPQFRPKWIERYVAADLKCLCGDPQKEACPMRVLSPTHFVINRRWYELDVQVVEIKPGLQPPELFDETIKGMP